VTGVVSSTAVERTEFIVHDYWFVTDLAYLTLDSRKSSVPRQAWGPVFKQLFHNDAQTLTWFTESSLKIMFVGNTIYDVPN
jgi:hypothetical protein